MGDRKEVVFLRSDLSEAKPGVELPIRFSDDLHRVMNITIKRQGAMPIAVLLCVDDSGIDFRFSLVFPEQEVVVHV